ncbi:hypothetical protein [Embleya sp. AB8]|uniref:hypothetical protein n=1 Tax=Embleya sp. AB8 TaxID=3156304 RepID=UPI003C72EF71
MNENLIRVRPTAASRTAFARWAVAQDPKVRTIGPDTFAVPADLFVHAPEELLSGAIVDGRRYVSPVEEAALGQPAPGAPEPPGVATAADLTARVPSEREGAPDNPLPDDTPIRPVQLDGAPGVDNDPRNHNGEITCDLCEREFTSTRGRDAHRRQAHPEA